MMNEKDTLAYKLRTYHEAGMYPFHMPGHKRKIPKEIDTLMQSIYTIDVTEIEGTDNLHHAEGILREAMDFATTLYGSDRSFFLVNGSTCGVMASIYACLERAKKSGKYLERPYILLATNAHFSAYHAIKLMGITPILIDVKKHGELGIIGSVEIDVVDRCLYMCKEEGKVPIAMFLTSPTFDGVLSDIETISMRCHAFDIPLIVDAAHGALFPFVEEEGLYSPITYGADLVIESLHKSLPSPTQTAILHCKGTSQVCDIVEESLRFFETSSPSYIFLSAIDVCIRYMAEHRQQVADLYTYIKDCRKHINQLHYVYAWYPKKHEKDAYFSYDIGKIILAIRGSNFVNHTKHGIIKGIQLQQILRRDYLIETEMATEWYVLALSGFGDTKDGFDRLYTALADIDRRLALYIQTGEDTLHLCSLPMIHTYRVEELAGTCARMDIYAYPPGIPLVRAGEILDETKAKEICKLLSSGVRIYGL